MSTAVGQAIFWAVLAVLVLSAIPMMWLWTHHRVHHRDHAGSSPPPPATGESSTAATREAPASQGGWKVLVEVVRLSQQDDHQLAYRTITGALEPRQPPDVLALQLAWPGRTAPVAGVCHSTSWRFEDADTLVLTYAATPDLAGSGGDQLGEPAIVSSGDALRPAPAQLHAHHIAAHAVRHLAYLARHDPALATAQRLHPELWQALADLAGRTPTGTHACAHELARRLLADPDHN